MARCWVHLLLPRIELITQKRKYLLITNWGEIKTAKSFLKPQASGEARTSIAYFSFSSSSSSSPILLEMTAAGSDACQWGEVPVNFLLRLIEIRDCLIIRIGLGKRDSIDCCWTQGPGEVKKKRRRGWMSVGYALGAKAFIEGRMRCSFPLPSIEHVVFFFWTHAGPCAS